MQNSNIGLLAYKENTNPIQYFPSARAFACIKELSFLFFPKTLTFLESFINSLSIQDPKQINPQSLIELEAFLEKISEENETLYLEIRQNCKKLFETISFSGVLSKEDFKSLFLAISSTTQENDFLESFYQLTIEDATEICMQKHTFLSENIKEYLGDLASLSEPSGLNLITTQHPFPIPNTYKYMQNNIEKIDYKFGLVWWKLLSNKT